MKMCNITNHQRNVNKNHMRYHLTPVRMAIIKKDNKDVGKGTTCAVLGPWYIGAAAMKNSN